MKRTLAGAQPWTMHAIRLPPVGLRECVARVAAAVPSEVQRLARGWPSLIREVARWRQDGPTDRWDELRKLVHGPW